MNTEREQISLFIEQANNHHSSNVKTLQSKSLSNVSSWKGAVFHVKVNEV